MQVKNNINQLQIEGHKVQERTHTKGMPLPVKFILFIFLCLMFNACNDKKKQNEKETPPQQSENPIIYEKAEPVELTPETVDAFINWASGSELEERENVRKEILKASKNEEVLKLLFNSYEKVTTNDFGYSLIVLSIIGEMQNVNSLPFFEKIIFQKIPENNEAFHSGLTQSDLVEILISKAVECAAYLRTAESYQLILKVASEHNSAAVRSSAIDAYLYNNNDSQEAKNVLEQTIRDYDINLIDRTRFTRNSTKEVFDDNLNSFYKKNPKEIPPDPEFIKPDDRQKDSTRIKIVQPINPPKRKQ